MRRKQSVRRKAFAFLFAALPLGVALFTACVSDKIGNKGAACDRASDCAGGLICAENLCTDDLSKLDGGTASNFNDTGTMASADAPSDGMGDAPPPPDGTPPPDTGTAPTDTGTPPDDTSTTD
ncbi:MAG: hypothetical protein ACXWUG_06930 [Polyangiales bacterium]